MSPDAQLQEIITKKYFDQIRKARLYTPETNDVFKNTFTDNMLYTTNYLESVTDENYKVNWTLELNKLFLNKLKLHETTVAKYMGLESRIFLILEDLKNSLNATHPDTLKSGIDKMHEAEAEKIVELKQILEGDKNFKIFWKFHKNFFENNNAKMRDLASDPNKNNTTQEPRVYSVDE